MLKDFGTLTPFADDVWLDTEPVRILGTRLCVTMSVIRLMDGSLLLYSPISLTSDRQARIESIGPVSHLYSPNTFHHMAMGDWISAFPEVRVHAPAGLAKKHREIRIARVHGVESEPAFDGVLEEIPIGGLRLEESVLYHNPSRTLFVADLVHNIGRPAHGWSKFYTRAMGFYDRVALSRMIRWTGFSDRTAARESIDRLLELPFERIVVGHGSPVVEDARAALEAAFAWLPPVRS